MATHNVYKHKGSFCDFEYDGEVIIIRQFIEGVGIKEVVLLKDEVKSISKIIDKEDRQFKNDMKSICWYFKKGD